MALAPGRLAGKSLRDRVGEAINIYAGFILAEDASGRAVSEIFLLPAFS